MAAFDLNAPAPGMLQIPNGINQGAQNLMQFMRLQQDNRNKRDMLDFQKTKEDNSVKQANSQLQHQQKVESNRLLDVMADNVRADQQLKDNTANLVADNTREDNKFKFDKGAIARKEAGNLRLNQALQGATDTAFQGLSDGFQLTPETIESYKKDSNYLSKSPEEQAAFDAEITAMFKDNAYQQVGRQRTEQALRQNLSNTHGSPEQLEGRIQKELESRFKPKDDQLFNTLVSLTGGGGRSGSSVGTNVGLDDTGELRATMKFVDEFEKAHNVEKGDGGFLPDIGATDLTQQNLTAFFSEMTNRGYNQVEAAAALKGHLNGDTAGTGFDEFLAGTVTEDFEPVLRSAKAIRALKAERQKQGSTGVGGNSQFLSNLISARENHGAPTTAAQRLEIIRGKLGSKIQQAQQDGNGSSGLDEETKKLIEEQSAIEYELGSGQQSNTAEQPNQLMQLMAGNNAGNVESIFQSIRNNTSKPLADFLYSKLQEGSEQVSDTVSEEGLLGVARKGISYPATTLTNLFSKPDTPREKIKDLKNELYRIHPVKGDKKRAEELKRMIALLSKG